MRKKRPIILAVVGKSDSGKTTLILKLLPKLKRKGYKVAVAKHCPAGFNLDMKGKDSWKFTQKGANGIFLSSPNEEALIRNCTKVLRLKDKLQDYFVDFDIVLLEGYKGAPGIKKIQIIRREIGGKVLDNDEIIAYISDIALKTKKLVLKLDDLPGIISVIESLKKLSLRRVA